MINRALNVCSIERRARLTAALTCLSRTALVSLLLFGIAACDPPEQADEAAVSDTPVVTSPNDQRRYDLILLENGLEVVLVSDPTVEKSAAALSVGLGAASDPTDYPGMAHYLEHMLLWGQPNTPSQTVLWPSPRNMAGCPMRIPDWTLPTT